MLTAEQVMDAYFLDVRCMLLEIAGTLDRHDAACARAGGDGGWGDPRLEKIYQSLRILADEQAGPGRAERLLNLFSEPAD